MYAMLTPVVKSIGVCDLDIDLFESQYPVAHGITYNSYVVEGAAECAVMDTVDAHFADEWMANLTDALGEGRTPAWLVVLHLEPDHSGTIARAMKAWPEMKLACSAKAATMLPQFFDEAGSWAERIVPMGEGSEIDLGGGVKLTFVTAPMVHWPEVLVAFEASEGTLFGADAFGTFGTPGHPEPWAPEAARYYFNICGKYGPQVQTLLKKASALPIKRVCALHGPVLEGEVLAEAVRLYGLWSAYEPDLEGVFIPYASIYGHTGQAAELLAELLRERGVKAETADLARCDMAEAVAKAFRYQALALAAASYDATVFPPMASFLHHLAIKGFRNRPVGLIQNGSWAPTAARAMRGMIEPMKQMTILEPEVTVKTRLTEANRPEMSALADALAAAIKK
ncbi:MAG: FprA family A-type flavoprotein [Bacteroides sp.]|nr:FprA family A-type flavoprotein [Bacteroides sp.]